MKPGARYAAAIEILDRHFAGEPVEKVLTNWSRQNRFAGSGDRAAIRDLVFAALRNKLSFAVSGDAMTGRGLMIGHMRSCGADIDSLFNGQGYAPAPLDNAEQAFVAPVMNQAVALDCPEWLMPELQRSLGTQFEAVMRSLQTRAPVFLRVNRRKISEADAVMALQDAGIATKPCELSPSALEVTTNERRVSNTDLYRNGLIEVQDAGSQWLADHVPIADGSKVLDYCAGGGGKSLSMAARVKARYYAYDLIAARMSDLPTRAKRAGETIYILSQDQVADQAPFDTVLCDVPCSGSGAWRRSPEGKWSFDRNKLEDILSVQREILDQATDMVGPKGVLAYATCSLMHCENRDQIADFLARSPGWQCDFQRAITPIDGGDGFFLALLSRV